VATATRIDDKANGWATTFEQDVGGIVIREHFRVDDTNYIAALQAVGLPAIGTPYGGLSTTVCQRRRVAHLGGGWVIVAVEYGPKIAPNGSLQDQNASPGDAFTRISESVDQVQVYQDIQGDNIEPTTVEANKLELVVDCYKTTTGWIGQWLGIANRLNSNQVTLPGVYGIGSPIICPPKTLLARTISEPVLVRDGLLKVSFRLAHAPADAFRYVYFDLDENGQPEIGFDVEIYEAVSYPAIGGGLW
jgi:hypothetical protein